MTRLVTILIYYAGGANRDCRQIESTSSLGIWCVLWYKITVPSSQRPGPVHHSLILYLEAYKWYHYWLPNILTPSKWKEEAPMLVAFILFTSTCCSLGCNRKAKGGQHSFSGRTKVSELSRGLPPTFLNCRKLHQYSWSDAIWKLRGILVMDS